MKTKSFAALCAAGLLLLASCNCGKENKNSSLSDVIAGKWTITNFADSSKTNKNSIGNAMLAYLLNDSTHHLTCEFGTDSLYYTDSGDTSKYYIDTAKQLFLREDSVYKPYSIQAYNDTAMNLFSEEDSVWYTLKKTK